MGKERRALARYRRTQAVLAEAAELVYAGQLHSASDLLWDNIQRDPETIADLLLAIANITDPEEPRDDSNQPGLPSGPADESEGPWSGLPRAW